MKLQLNQKRSEVGRALGEDHKPPPMKEGGPKHGEFDGKQHIGGNRFAGGSGGTGTAGLGGRAGPYRLDVGQDIHMLSEEEKKGVSQARISPCPPHIAALPSCVLRAPSCAERASTHQAHPHWHRKRPRHVWHRAALKR